MTLKSSTTTNRKNRSSRAAITVASGSANESAPKTIKRAETARRKNTTSEKLAPIHPGKILKSQLMEPYRLSANKLANLLGVPANRIAQIIKGERDITVDTALRLSRCFNMSAHLWLNLQSRYEMEVAEDQHIPEKIQNEVTVFKSSGKAATLKP